LLDFAFARGMNLIEAGAQGEHKVKRGYLPVVTHSAHRCFDSALDDAVRRFVVGERVVVEREIEGAQLDGPFRADAIPDFPPVAGQRS
jgi:predicted N-acyltransferase